jgi:hypothetical protein
MHKLPRTDVIATSFGAIAFVADEPTHVPPEMVREVEAAGAVEIKDDVEVGQAHVEVDLDELRASLAAEPEAPAPEAPAPEAPAPEAPAA